MAVGNRLEAAGFPVLYTRTTDVYQRPIDKARIANESGGDYFVSFHRNSSPERNTYSGVQTLVFADEGIKGQLARNINAELAKVGFNDLGVPERTNLVVLKRTQMPAVLIETGFINTDADNELFDTRFDDIADAIARAIEETVGDNTVAQAGATANERDAASRQSTANAQTAGSTAADGQNTIYAQPAGSTAADGRNITYTQTGNSAPVADDNRYGRSFAVQVGLYRRYENALYQAAELRNKGYYVEVRNMGPYYAVLVGREDDLDDAALLARALQRDGYDTLVVNA